MKFACTPSSTIFESLLIYFYTLYVSFGTFQFFRATNLTGMNVNIAGKPGNSDPYLRVTLGKFVFDDRQNAVDDVKETDLYKVIIIKAELPGASQLAIEVMDKNTFSSDALIGKTVIDLEDRWFDARWQALGIDNRYRLYILLSEYF